jgi:hypothetical protein
MINENRQVNIEQITEIFPLSVRTVHSIIHSEQNFRKTRARCVPQMLTADYTTQGLRICRLLENRHSIEN